MNKKAISLVIATISLIALGIALGIIIYNFSKSYILQTSPPIDSICQEVALRVQSEIYENDDSASYSIAIINRGNTPIYGVSVKISDQGTTTDLENINIVVAPGSTETKLLASINSNNRNSNFLVVPIVSPTDDKNDLQTCPNSYGQKLKVILNGATEGS